MIKKQSNELAGEGYRVIALAYGKKKELDKKASYGDDDHVVPPVFSLA